MKRHYIVYLICIVIVCVSGGIAIGLNLQPEPIEESEFTETQDSMEEYIKQRRKELENPDTTFRIPPDEDGPIIHTRYKNKPIEAPAMESR